MPEREAKSRLPRVDYPRLDALFRFAEHVWDTRADLRETFRDIDNFEFWLWLMWDGTREYALVRELSYPLPPEYLIQRVLGEGSRAQVYHGSGIVDCRRMHDYLLEGGFEFGLEKHLLDFGCGSARLLRIFSRHAGGCRFYGADVDREAVEWCEASLEFGTFHPLALRPPSGFADEQFDGVYAFSVFSHLRRDVHRAWLGEIRRITKPGGVVVLTVQGRRVVEEFLAHKNPELKWPTPRRLRADLKELERTGFKFYPFFDVKASNSRNQTYWDGYEADMYGATFILPHYIRENWLDLFELLAIHEAPDEWQDYVVLKRR
jgi:SAM-dependent methyltransferase